MTSSIAHPLSEFRQPIQLQKIVYGPGYMEQHLKPCLSFESCKAYIITRVGTWGFRYTISLWGSVKM
ncbi:hypothetical protein F5884DRAFT_802283, partial [Xylogone sp. PMI_703]